jgi:hypothetical protein
LKRAISSINFKEGSLYGLTPNFEITVNSKFQTSLNQALNPYHNSPRDALNLIYLQKIFVKVSSLETESGLERLLRLVIVSIFQSGNSVKNSEISPELQLETEEQPFERKVHRSILTV